MTKTMIIVYIYNSDDPPKTTFVWFICKVLLTISVSRDIHVTYYEGPIPSNHNCS